MGEMEKVAEIARHVKIKRELDHARVEADRARAAERLPSLDERLERIEAAEEDRAAQEVLAKRRPAPPPPGAVTLVYKPKAAPVLRNASHEGPRTSVALGLAVQAGDLAAIAAARKAGVEVPVSAPDAKGRQPKGTKPAKPPAPPKAPKPAAEARREPAPTADKPDVLDMHHAICKAYAPGAVGSERMDTIPATMHRAVMLGEAWSIGVDLRPEGVRERQLPEDKPALPEPEKGIAVGAWLNGAPIKLEDGLASKGERHCKAVFFRLILKGRADRAVIARSLGAEMALAVRAGKTGEELPTCGRQLELRPKLAPVVQVAANGIERPTAERYGWEGATNARPDRDDKFQATVTIPTLIGLDGLPRKVVRKTVTEAEARSFVLTMIGEEGASEGEIESLGDSALTLCLEDPRFIADVSHAITDRLAVVNAIPGAAEEKCEARPKDTTVYERPKGSKLTKGNARVKLGGGPDGKARYARRYQWQGASDDGRGGRAYAQRG